MNRLKLCILAVVLGVVGVLSGCGGGSSGGDDGGGDPVVKYVDGSEILSSILMLDGNFLFHPIKWRMWNGQFLAQPAGQWVFVLVEPLKNGQPFQGDEAVTSLEVDIYDLNGDLIVGAKFDDIGEEFVELSSPIGSIFVFQDGLFVDRNADFPAEAEVVPYQVIKPDGAEIAEDYNESSPLITFSPAAEANGVDVGDVVMRVTYTFVDTGDDVVGTLLTNDAVILYDHNGNSVADVDE